MKSLPGALRVCLCLSREQVWYRLNFEKSRVNPRNDNDSDLKSRLARCDANVWVPINNSAHFICSDTYRCYNETITTAKLSFCVFLYLLVWNGAHQKVTLNWICNRDDGKPLWRVWFVNRAGGWMSRADLPLSMDEVVGGTRHSCLPMYSHCVVTWDTSPYPRWGRHPKSTPDNILNHIIQSHKCLLFCFFF